MIVIIIIKTPFSRFSINIWLDMFVERDWEGPLSFVY